MRKYFYRIQYAFGICAAHCSPICYGSQIYILNTLHCFFLPACCYCSSRRCTQLLGTLGKGKLLMLTDPDIQIY